MRVHSFVASALGNQKEKSCTMITSVQTVKKKIVCSVRGVKTHQIIRHSTTSAGDVEGLVIWERTAVQKFYIAFVTCSDDV